MSKPWDIVPGLSNENLRFNLNQPAQDDQERILGDSFSAFERSQRPGNRYLVAGFLCMILLAGAVGGGLGGGLAAQQRQCTTAAADDSSTTTTVIVTATLPTSTTPTPPLSTTCDSSEPYTAMNPSAPNTAYKINGTTLTYALLCSQNLPATPDLNPTFTDIQQINFNNPSSIYTCIDACALYNYQIPSTAELSGKGLDVSFPAERLCRAISFGPGPSATQKSCILKTKSNKGPGNHGDGDVRYDSAVLMWLDPRLRGAFGER